MVLRFNFPFAVQATALPLLLLLFFGDLTLAEILSRRSGRFLRFLVLLLFLLRVPGLPTFANLVFFGRPVVVGEVLGDAHVWWNVGVSSSLSTLPPRPRLRNVVTFRRVCFNSESVGECVSEDMIGSDTPVELELAVLPVVSVLEITSAEPHSTGVTVSPSSKFKGGW